MQAAAHDRPPLNLCSGWPVTLSGSRQQGYISPAGCAAALQRAAAYKTVNN